MNFWKHSRKVYKLSRWGFHVKKKNMRKNRRRADNYMQLTLRDF